MDSSMDEDGDFIMVADEREEHDSGVKQHLGETVTNPEIYEMTIESNVRHRYARTVVTSKVQNLNSKAREITFSVILPDKAFISEFVMVIGGKEYKAYVKEKETAKAIYDQAVFSGAAAAHVAVSARESNRFTVSVNVEPLSKATFLLTYEEWLRRKENMYELIINIHPKQPVPNLFVNVLIDESRPLKFVKTPALRSGNEILKETVDLDPKSEIHQLNPRTAVVKFKPSVERQKQLATTLGTDVKEGLAGQFVVQYDVERDPSGGEVLLQGGYFVHFFAPSDIKLMNKFIVFVLDTSGSMDWGQKMPQLKQAMNAILDQLDINDYFQIIGFESVTRVWDILNPTRSTQIGDNRHLFGSQLLPEPILTNVKYPVACSGNSDNIKNAKIILTELHPGGGTNIYEALKVALDLIEREKLSGSHKNLPQPIIMFLTDGDPTVGIVDREVIVSNITNLNKEYVPIFSLSFGNDADKTFLKKLSLKNQGFFRHIYEASDAAIQLRNFYKEIASPLLRNVKFEYVSETTSLTKTVFPIYFAGSEIVVSGQYNFDTFAQIPRVTCTGVTGPTILQARIEKPVTSLERLWAYLTVQQLLDERDILEDKSVNEKKALNLALQYSFVTPVSSLVVVKPDSNNSSVNPEAADNESKRRLPVLRGGGPPSCQLNFASPQSDTVGVMFGSSASCSLPLPLQQSLSTSGFGSPASRRMLQSSFMGAAKVNLNSTSVDSGNFGFSCNIPAQSPPMSDNGFICDEEISEKKRVIKKKKGVTNSSYRKSEESGSSTPKTGLNTELINNKIKSKIATIMKYEDRPCVVCFDEFKLKKSLGTYVTDVGGKEVDHGLVFYVRGLLYQWTLPFCYFLSQGPMKANELKDVIVEVIEKLLEIGLHPRALVCDHSFNNRNALSALGASLINTAITVNNTTIYTFYDSPQLLNSLRNNFMNEKLKILVRGKAVSWLDVIHTYDLKRLEHGMDKITEKHIRPTVLQGKNVQLSAQVFSKTVATAITSVTQNNQLLSSTANHTAMFVDKLNDIFDILNSSDAHNVHALSASNPTSVQALKEAEDFFTNIEIYKINNERKYVYSISGFIWTIKSTLQLWQSLQREGVSFLLTRRLNLDPIRNFILRLRTAGGTNSLPTCNEFDVAFQDNIIDKLKLSIGASDCEANESGLSGIADADETMEEASENLSKYSDFDE